jgi:DNA-binding transcriptional LysR family regulator
MIVDEARHVTVAPAGCSFEPLFDDPMLVALPAAHPLAGASWIDLGDLSADPWIDGVQAGAPGSTLLRNACLEAGFAPRVAFASDNYQVVSRLVAAGQGVGLVPLLAVAEARPGIVVRRVCSRPHRRVSMAMVDGEPSSPDLSLTLSALRAQARRWRRRANSMLAAADLAGPLPPPTVLRPVA